jgi:hypothetical protein
MNNLYIFIFGLIIGYMLVYLSSNMVIYHGPNSNEIKNNYYYKNGNKYRFIPKLI